ncbi:MAG: DUF3387 domain-containing protein [Acidobacteria bacterium]|nr:DUF3387 domain-containing protein [Acidobacteriota bacterium]
MDCGFWIASCLSKAFALCAASDEATALRDDISYFQAISAALGKQNSNGKRSPEQLDAAASPFWIFDFGFWIATPRNCSKCL